jgi:hypothetical protein
LGLQLIRGQERMKELLEWNRSRKKLGQELLLLEQQLFQGQLEQFCMKQEPVCTQL